jgi:Zn-dependent peptidase ImmA (M78 family)
MKMGEKVFNFGIVLQFLWRIWEPAGVAFRVKHALGVRSLEETTGALGRAGYEVCSVDLPEPVSGVAAIIADRPHIVLNRAKSQEELQYTVLHELGHHTLHLKPVRDYDPLGFPGSDDAEREADLFAAFWLLFLRDSRQRNAVLLWDPEISKILAFHLVLSVIFVLCALLMSLMLHVIPETK